MQMKNIIIVVAALAAGVAAGWFAGVLVGRVVPNAPMAAAWDKPPLPAERSNATARADAARPKRKAPIRSTADAEVQKRILENKISYLEKCIAAAKVSDAKPAETSARQTPR